MRIPTPALPWILTALVAGLGLPDPSEAAADASASPLEVVVSIPPQADLVERIGGSGVRASVMIPPGSSPHTYAPSPRQLATLARASLVLLVGHPDFLFEARHIAPQLQDNARIQVVDMSEDLAATAPRRDDASHSSAIESHRHTERDPHVWLSPSVMESAARRLADSLAGLDPESASTYASRLQLYLADLAALDHSIRGRFDPLPDRRFLVFHPAWGWFADHYDMVQLAVEREGKESGPRRVIPVIEEARAMGCKVIFSQKGFASRGADAIARELGAAVVELDPLARDWFTNLEKTAIAIEGALARE